MASASQTVHRCSWIPDSLLFLNILIKTKGGSREQRGASFKFDFNPTKIYNKNSPTASVPPRAWESHIDLYTEHAVCFPALHRVTTPYFVDGEFSLKATTPALIQRNLHGVVDVTDLMAAHLILDVQTHHWNTTQQTDFFFLQNMKKINVHLQVIIVLTRDGCLL